MEDENLICDYGRGKRKANFSRRQMEAILDEIMIKENQDILFSYNFTPYTNEQKDYIWKAITDKVNAADPLSEKRTVSNVRRKWVNLLSFTKKRFIENSQCIRIMTPLERRIINLVNERPSLWDDSKRLDIADVAKHLNSRLTTDQSQTGTRLHATELPDVDTKSTVTMDTNMYIHEACLGSDSSRHLDSNSETDTTLDKEYHVGDVVIKQEPEDAYDSVTNGNINSHSASYDHQLSDQQPRNSGILNFTDESCHHSQNERNENNPIDSNYENPSKKRKLDEDNIISMAEKRLNVEKERLNVEKERLEVEKSRLDLEKRRLQIEEIKLAMEQDRFKSEKERLLLSKSNY